MGITYLTGDATEPQGQGFKILAHICNDVGGWGAGFVVALSKRWRAPEREYREAYAEGDITLGYVQYVPIDNERLLVANMVAQEGVSTHAKGRSSAVYVRYDALWTCLQDVANTAFALRATVHMPRIGTGLGGGRWEAIEPIIRRTMGRVPVYVYDLREQEPSHA